MSQPFGGEKHFLPFFSSENENALTPIERHGDIWMKRDDLFEIAGIRGGKVRTCWHLAQGAKGLVAGSHRHSPQMAMTARIANLLNIPCRIHTAFGGETSEIADAVSFGAVVVRHKPGYNNVIIHRARVDALERGWTEIPFGMESQMAVDLTSQQVKNLPKEIDRVVVPVGCGMSLAGILQGMVYFGRKMPVLGIMVGSLVAPKFLDRWAPFGWRSWVELTHALQPYNEHVHREIDGILLDPVYEAKCVDYLKPRDLFWCVGIRTSPHG